MGGLGTDEEEHVSDRGRRSKPGLHVSPRSGVGALKLDDEAVCEGRWAGPTRGYLEGPVAH